MAGLQSASLLENARLNAFLIVPNALQGLFRRRRAAVAAATRANVDGQAIGLLAGMARRHSRGPVWVRVLRDRALLLLSAADVHRALAASPDPFAPDPSAKRDGMVAFQPDALTISRGELWRERRRFTEAVLDTGRPLHRFAERFAAVAAEEADALVGGLEEPGELGWEPWQAAFRRLTRRVVLGDAARDDEELSDVLREMMSEGNGMPGEPSERLPGFLARIDEYVAAAEDGSLVSLFAEAPAGERTEPSGQAAHWLFATHDTLAINAFRALALVASHAQQRGRVEEELETAGVLGEDGPAGAEPVGGGAGPASAEAIAGLDYLGGCLSEAMRLWPTTPILSRETLSETDWNGVMVPAGTQVLIPNTFLHRDRERDEHADRFVPARWTDGDAAEDWRLNHFSRGPQGCPGAGLALFLGKATLARLLATHELELRSPNLDPSRPLPAMLDFFALRFRLALRPR